jgi:hypothetical protein
VIVSEVAEAERTGRSKCSSEVAQDERTGRGRAGASGCRCDCQDFVKKKRDRGEIVATTKDMTATAKGTAAKKFFLDSFIFLVLPKIFNFRKRPGTEIQGP